jgi:formamidopyrimidine-DNA glycosylase
MPELPEVETIVRGLRDKLTHQKVSKVVVNLDKCVRGSPQIFALSLKGKKILDVQRRGKNILIGLNGGSTLRIHLGMTGRLKWVPGHASLEKHTHVVFSFRGQSWQLRFLDSRQFGRLSAEENRAGGKSDFLARLGPEPLEIPAREFLSRLRFKRRVIKPLLLDQHFLAGVGNIYADETLHRAQIHPRQRVEFLGDKTLLRLHHVLCQVLQEAIQAGGSSVRTYVDAGGSTGRFQKYLRVYGKEGEACQRCGMLIRREKVGGRSSFFCPKCQMIHVG